MSDLQHLQGQAVDWGSTEVSIDGQPFAAGFTSMSYKGSLKPEMVYVNGSPDPQARTQGKAEYEASAELPYKNFVILRELLGGGGATGFDYKLKEFEVTVSHRPNNDPSIYTDKLEALRITDDDYSGSQGSSTTVKLTFSVMKIRSLPPS